MKYLHTCALSLILCLLIAITAGCAASERSSKAAVPPAMPQPGDREMASIDKTTTDESGKSGSEEEYKTYTGPRMIIYTARIYLDVKNIESVSKKLADMVKESRGYFTASSMSTTDGTRKSGSFTIKVPAEALASFTDKICQLGEVSSQSQAGQDVTEEFVDQSARLHNMEIEEKRYQEMYDRAKSVDDMLKVRKELGRVRGDIEALQGRLNYLKNNVAMATVELTLSEHSQSTPRSFWNLKGTVGDAFTALKFMAKFFVVLIIYAVIVFGPFVILIVLLVKAFRKVKRAKVAAPPEPHDTPGTAAP